MPRSLLAGLVYSPKGLTRYERPTLVYCPKKDVFGACPWRRVFSSFRPRPIKLKEKYHEWPISDPRLTNPRPIRQ